MPHGMLGLVKSGTEMAARAAALPGLLGLRWFSRREWPPAPIRSGRGLLLGIKKAADELVFATEVVAGAPIAFLDARRIRREVEQALRLYGERGWLDDPRAYHQRPPPLESVDLTAGWVPGVSYQHLRFESGYAPRDGEPGRDRWLAYEPNHTAHARLFRHPGPPRPWVVCLPAYRMGHPLVDIVAFRILTLHRTLGLNVAVPVFPFHGRRAIGRRGGDGFLSGDFLDTIHGQAQAVWDARRLIGWLRHEGAPAVGIYGLSLGAYTTALLASLDEQLDCVIAGIPAVDFLGLFHANTSVWLIRVTQRLGFPWEQIGTLLRVISPLSVPLQVPKDRCHLFAGVADGLAPAKQAHDLWRHWGQPRIIWYQGGHVSFLIEGEVQSFVTEALGRMVHRLS